MLQLLLVHIILRTKRDLLLDWETLTGILVLLPILILISHPKVKIKDKKVVGIDPKSCSYYSGNYQLKCAVNPHLPCNECKEYDPIP